MAFGVVFWVLVTFAMADCFKATFFVPVGFGAATDFAAAVFAAPDFATADFTVAVGAFFDREVPRDDAFSSLGFFTLVDECTLGFLNTA